jgi:hypothetical protein
LAPAFIVQRELFLYDINDCADQKSYALTVSLIDYYFENPFHQICRSVEMAADIHERKKTSAILHYRSALGILYEVRWKAFESIDARKR